MDNHLNGHIKLKIQKVIMSTQSYELKPYLGGLQGAGSPAGIVDQRPVCRYAPDGGTGSASVSRDVTGH